MRVPRLLGAPLALLLLAATAACGDDGDEVASPFADCATLTAPPPSAPAVPATPAARVSDVPATAVAALPDLTLPCFTGGREVALRDVRGPAVINVWASWCQPCRAELPVMQNFATRTAGRLHVIGVDAADQRADGASFAADKGVTLPTLFDADNQLPRALGRINLPVTVFVDAAGRSYVHLLPLDAPGLAEQARRHTGVAVTP